MTLKIKDKKLFGQNCILDNFILRENLNNRGPFVDKGSGSGIFPDPDPQHWILQLCSTLSKYVIVVFIHKTFVY